MYNVKLRETTGSDSVVLLDYKLVLKEFNISSRRFCGIPKSAIGNHTLHHEFLFNEIFNLLKPSGNFTYDQV
jgi:hypothetical protein